MGRSLLVVLVLGIVLAIGVPDARSEALDKEYAQLMGENVLQNLNGEHEQPVKSAEDSVSGEDFNPHDELHNEEYKKWAAGEPYMMKKSNAANNGYVCQQFTLPTDGGVSLTMLGVKDLNACKCACNERKGQAMASGHVGCNAFAYLAGQNSKQETNVTVNECHLKRHFLYHEDWQKVVNPWIFCVQEDMTPPTTGIALESEVGVAWSTSSFDSQTYAIGVGSALFGGLIVASAFIFCQRKSAKNYLLMVDDEI